MVIRAVIREDMTELDAERAAKIIKKPREECKMVLDAVIEDRRNHRRQPKPPAPERGISIAAGGEKYKVPKPTIWRWVHRDKVIPILLPTNRETYIDETALAKIVEVYHQNPGKGKWTVRKYMLGQ